MYPVRGAWEWVCTQSGEPGNKYVQLGSLGMGMYPVREPGNECVPSQGAWEWVCTQSGSLGMSMYPVREPGNEYVPSKGAWE